MKRRLSREQERELARLLAMQRQKNRELSNKALALRFGLKPATFDLYKSRWLRAGHGA